MAQALISQEYKKLYFTGRGPRSVLTTNGVNQTHFFSIHVRSDTYANNLLKQMHMEGATSVALIYEEYGNAFYEGLGEEARPMPTSRL